MNSPPQVAESPLISARSLQNGRFFVAPRKGEMPEQEKTEMVEQPEAEQVEDIQNTEAPEESDDFDKERAMATIKKLREFEKKAVAYEKKLQKYEEAEAARKQAEMTEMEKMQARADEAEQKLKQIELLELKRSIAKEADIPVEWAERLQGKTPEELKADAEALSATMPKQSPKISATNPGDNATGKSKTDIERLRELRTGGNENIFSVVGNADRGGGVYQSATGNSGVVE